MVDLASLQWAKLGDCIRVEELVEGASVAPPPRTVVDHGQDPVEAASATTPMLKSLSPKQHIRRLTGLPWESEPCPSTTPSVCLRGRLRPHAFLRVGSAGQGRPSKQGRLEKPCQRLARGDMHRTGRTVFVAELAVVSTSVLARHVEDIPDDRQWSRARRQWQAPPGCPPVAQEPHRQRS